jgi:type VI secretion system ImpA family protein
MRHAPLYDAIQEARAQSDARNLPEGVWQADTQETDWRKVQSLCTQLLTRQSKDLQVVAWLVEANLMLEGLEGLNEGLRLLQDLSTAFWDSVHPLPETEAGEEGAWESRLVPFDWLDYHLPQSLVSLVITQPNYKDFLAYTLADWLDAVYLDKVSRKQEDPQGFLESEGRPLLSALMASVKQTPLSFYDTLKTQVEKAQALLKGLEAFVSDKTHQEVSFFFHLREKLDLLLTSLHTWHKNALLPSQGETKASRGKETPDKRRDEADIPPFLDHSAPQGAPGSVTKRREAYALIEKVATFLLENDPHSPTPYLLRQALTWENKGLPDVYAAFASDPQQLFCFMQLLRS